MKKTRKSSMMVRLVAILAVTMMFTMCFVGGTFAKYTSTGTGSDTATVAKWSFKVGATDIAATNTFTFDLFNNTVKDSNGNDETDMSPVNGSIIAPGTQGSFALVLTNESQVNATYAIDYTVTNTSNIPVQFSVDNGTTWTNTLADVPATTIAHTDGTTTITVKWKWVFETYKVVDTEAVSTPAAGTNYYTLNEGVYTLAENLETFAGGTTYYTLEDAFDTSLGSAATATLKVDAKVTATQVD